MFGIFERLCEAVEDTVGCAADRIACEAYIAGSSVKRSVDHVVKEKPAPAKTKPSPTKEEVDGVISTIAAAIVDDVEMSRRLKKAVDDEVEKRRQQQSEDGN